MTMNLGFYQRIGTQGTQDHTCITGRLEVEKPHQSSLLPSPMPLKKTKKKKRRLESIAALYTEDIGTEGVKKSSMATGALHQGSNFHLPLTEDEENRRRKRMVRQLQLGRSKHHLSSLLRMANVFFVLSRREGKIWTGRQKEWRAKDIRRTRCTLLSVVGFAKP